MGVLCCIRLGLSLEAVFLCSCGYPELAACGSTADQFCAHGDAELASVLTRSGDAPHPAPVQAGGLLLDGHQPGHCSWGWGWRHVEHPLERDVAMGWGQTILRRKNRLHEKGSSAGVQSGSSLRGE